MLGLWDEFESLPAHRDDVLALCPHLTNALADARRQRVHRFVGNAFGSVWAPHARDDLIAR